MRVSNEQMLGLGLVGGFLLVVFGLVTETTAVWTDGDVVARVNGTAIEIERYEQALEAQSSGASAADFTGEQRLGVLNDLVTEELLVDRAITLGLARQDPMARRHLLRAVTGFATQNAAAYRPSAREVRRYYQSNQAKFVGSIQYEVVNMYFKTSGSDLSPRVEAAVLRLKGGEDFCVVKSELADKVVAEAPQGLVSVATLRNYLGPTVAKTAQALKPGELSDPIRVSGGFRIIKLVARAQSEAPSYQAVERLARRLVIKEKEREDLKRYVEELRRGAEISLNTDLIVVGTRSGTETSSRSFADDAAMAVP